MVALTITQKLNKCRMEYAKNEDVMFLIDLVDRLTEENTDQKELLHRVVKRVAEIDRPLAVAIEGMMYA